MPQGVRMSGWKVATVALRFSISDLTLGSWRLRLCTREVSLTEDLVPESSVQPPVAQPGPACVGFLLRGVPVTPLQVRLSSTLAYIRYVEREYRHFYIDLGLTFDRYKEGFSSKTRSTIVRKLKKFREHCGGAIHWATYRSSGEMEEFHRYARMVSAL